MHLYTAQEMVNYFASEPYQWYMAEVDSCIFPFSPIQTSASLVAFLFFVSFSSAPERNRQWPIVWGLDWRVLYEFVNQPNGLGWHRTSLAIDEWWSLTGKRLGRNRLNQYHRTVNSNFFFCLDEGFVVIVAEFIGSPKNGENSPMWDRRSG